MLIILIPKSWILGYTTIKNWQNRKPEIAVRKSMLFHFCIQAGFSTSYKVNQLSPISLLTLPYKHSIATIIVLPAEYIGIYFAYLPFKVDPPRMLRRL